MALIAPSLLAADFARLGEALEMIEAAGATLVHVDVMDGHFVPEISVGLPVIESLRKATDLALDVHLLVERPERYVGDFLNAGADRLCFHREATVHLPRLLQSIRAKKAKAGIAITYPTALDSVTEILSHIDFLTILCGEPMVEDDSMELIAGSIEKVRAAAQARADRRLDFAIQAEGGINSRNLGDLVRAGADILVAGSAIFHNVDPRAQLSEMIRLAAGIHLTSKT